MLVATAGKIARRPWVGQALPLLVILGVAAYLRLHDLTDLPPPLHPDEAGQGISGLELMDGKQPLLGFGWAYHLNTAYLLSGLVLKLFGATVWNLRVTEAAFGITAVVVTYLLGRSMFSWRVGLVASALLAFNHFALAFSRIGLVNQQSMTVQLVAFLLLWEVFRRRRPLLTALGGAAAGAGLYLYFASWVVPVILGAVLLWAAVFRLRDARTVRYLGLWAVFGFMVLVVPWLAFPVLNLENFRERPTDVFILPEMEGHKERWQTDSALEVLRQQAIHTVRIFFRGGDTSNQYGYDAPLLDPFTRWFFLLGLAIAVILLLRPPYAFLLLWFGITLVIGGVLTESPPFMPRLVGMIPATMLLTALGMVKPLELIVRRWPSRSNTDSGMLRRALPMGRLLLPRVSLIALGIITFLSFQWHYKAYFLEYPSTPHTVVWPWIEPMSSIGGYLSTQEEGTMVYLFRTPAVFLDHASVRFYVYGRRLHLNDVKCSAGSCDIPRPGDGKTVYIFVPETRDGLAAVKREFPQGVLKSFAGNAEPQGARFQQFAAYEVAGER